MRDTRNNNKYYRVSFDREPTFRNVLNSWEACQMVGTDFETHETPGFRTREAYSVYIPPCKRTPHSILLLLLFLFIFFFYCVFVVCTYTTSMYQRALILNGWFPRPSSWICCRQQERGYLRIRSTPGRRQPMFCKPCSDNVRLRAYKQPAARSFEWRQPTHRWKAWVYERCR
jgi:hypothetical protein